MSKTAKGECPRCGSELVVEWWTENHKVHNGIGMQTVAKDHHRDIIEMTCDHQPDMFTEDEMDDLFHDAAEDLAQQHNDYYAEQYDQLKDEGKI